MINNGKKLLYRILRQWNTGGKKVPALFWLKVRSMFALNLWSLLLGLLLGIISLWNSLYFQNKLRKSIFFTDWDKFLMIFLSAQKVQVSLKKPFSTEFHLMVVLSSAINLYSKTKRFRRDWIIILSLSTSQKLTTLRSYAKWSQYKPIRLKLAYFLRSEDTSNRLLTGWQINFTKISE